MMERGTIASPDATKAVSTLGMTRMCQRVTDQTPLHRQVLRLIDRKTLINGIADRQVVKDHIMLPIASTTDSIVVMLELISQTHAYIPYYYMAAINHQGLVFQTDAITWGSLSRNSDTVVIDS